MTDAELRLRQWLRDYGHEKQPAFVADLNALLGEVARLRAVEREFVEHCTSPTRRPEPPHPKSGP